MSFFRSILVRSLQRSIRRKRSWRRPRRSGKAKLDVERDTPLAQARAIAQSQLDTEIQAKLGAEALVLAAKANIEQAQLNVEWTRSRLW
jgi:multidrug efflux pump subunit AcrA (membrane-fusion protein)